MAVFLSTKQIMKNKAFKYATELIPVSGMFLRLLCFRIPDYTNIFYTASRIPLQDPGVDENREV